MNSNKMNNGWILCPSKSFPGKFYYFNVVNGETAWSLNETEKLKNGPVQKIDKQQSYPEPNSPPVDSTPTVFKPPNIQNVYPREIIKKPKEIVSSNSYTRENNLNTVYQKNDSSSNIFYGRNVSNENIPQSNNVINQSSNIHKSTNIVPQTLFLDRPIATFGQAVYPKSLPPINRVPFSSDKDNPQVVMILMNQNDHHKPMLEPKIQFEMTETEPDRGLFLQTTHVPLSQRFANFGTPVINFNNNVERPPIKYGTSTIPKSLPTGFTHNQSYMNDCGLSNKVIPVENSSTKYVLREPIFNFSQQMFEEEKIPIVSEKSHFTPKTFSNENFASKITFKPNADNSNAPKVCRGASGLHVNLFSENQSSQASLSGTILSKTNTFESNQHSAKIYDPNRHYGNIYDAKVYDGNMSGPIQNTKFSDLNQYHSNMLDPNQHNVNMSNPNPFHTNISETNQHYPNMADPNEFHTNVSGSNPHCAIFDPNQHYTNMSDPNQHYANMVDPNQQNANICAPSCSYTLSKNSNTETISTGKLHVSSEHTKPNVYKSVALKNTLQIENGKIEFRKKSVTNQTPVFTENIHEDVIKDTTNQTYLKNKEIKPTANKRTRIEYADSNEGLDHVTKLDKNDLRLKLMAKNRKPVDLENIQGQRIRTTRQEIPKAEKKKKVTFNLEPESYSDMGSTYEDFSRNDTEHMTHDEDNLQYLQEEQDNWYVVVDTEVMIEELKFLGKFVTSDVKCKLLIPSAVMSETKALARGGCHSRRVVILARNSLRWLATPLSHVIVQESDEDENMEMSTSDSIINLCLEVMEERYVVLITNDQNLQLKAETYDINCFTVQDIKDGAKKKMSVPIIHENSYLDCKVPTHAFKKKLFDDNEQNYSNVDAIDNKLDASDSQSTSMFEDQSNTKYIEFRKNFRRLSINEDNQNGIQKDDESTDLLSKITTTPNKERDVPNSKEVVSRFFPTPSKLVENEMDSQSETVSFFFQNENKDTNSVASNLKLPYKKWRKDEKKNCSFDMPLKPRKESWFEVGINETTKKTQQKDSVLDREVDGIEILTPNQHKTNQHSFEDKSNTKFTEIPIFSENIKSNIAHKPNVIENREKGNFKVQFNSSIFKNVKPPSGNVPKMTFGYENKKYEHGLQSNNVFQTEKSNTETGTRPDIFGKEKYKTRESQSNFSTFDRSENTRTHEEPFFEIEKRRKRYYQENHSISEIGKRMTRDHQPNTSVSEIEKYSRSMPSIFEMALPKTKHFQSSPSIFEIEKQRNNGLQRPTSLFEIEEKEIVMGKIEYYLKKFCVKNEMMDERIKERKEELLCIFLQAMEDCLSDVLQQSNAMQKSMPPPYTLFEAAQCISRMYESNTTIVKIVDVMCGLLYDFNSDVKEQVNTQDLMKGFGCGLMLIGCLKNITENTDALSDSEHILNEVLKSLEDPNQNIEAVPLKQPLYCRCDGDCENHGNKKNFVKEPSYVISYLKKHFTAWTDFEETLEDENAHPVWGQNQNNDAKVVRAFGKDLSALKIHKSKTITVKYPNNKDKIEENTNTTDENKIMNTQVKNIKNKNVNVNKTDLASKNTDTNKLSSKENHKTINNVTDTFSGLHVTTVINETPIIPNQRDKLNPQASFVKENNFKGDTKKTEPKVIRLFSNSNLAKDHIKDKTAVDLKKSILDIDYKTYGHTFGTGDKTGPTIVRNIKLIKEYEDKLVMKREELDLDVVDCTAITDDENSDDTDKNCISVDINENEKDFFDTLNNESNDHIINLKPTNKNALSHNEMTNDSCVTNNECYSMSLDTPALRNDNRMENDEIKDENHATDDLSFNNKYFKSDNANIGRNMRNNATNKPYASYSNIETDASSSVTNDNPYRSSGKNENSVVLNNDTYDITEVRSKFDKDTTDDIGHNENENKRLQVYLSVKSFLYELSNTLKMVHLYIKENMEEYCNANLTEDKKAILHNKSSAMHDKITMIMDNLKLIIQRESKAESTTLKSSLAANDRITRYKEVVEKCLKQAHILEGALKIMVSITGGDDKESITITKNSNNNSDKRYFNIFGK